GMAGKEGIAALEAVHNAGGHEGLDRTVNGGRAQRLAADGQPLEHLVGADGLVRGGDLAKHRLPQGRELQTLVLKRLARPLHRLLEAKVVIVPWCGKGFAGDGLRHCCSYSTRAWLRHLRRPPWAGFRHVPVMSRA